MNKPITVADLIAQYIKLRDTIAKKQASFDQDGMSEEDQEMFNHLHTNFNQKIANRFAFLATGVGTYKNALAVIENAITGHLMALGNEEGKRNISIPGVGVAFRQQWTSAKVVDGDSFFDFVIDNNERQMLTLHVAKDAVKEYMETHNGQLPPGIDWAHGWKTLIRKS